MERGKYNVKITNLSKKSPKLRFKVDVDADGDIIGITVYDVQEGQEENMIIAEGESPAMIMGGAPC